MEVASAASIATSTVPSQRISIKTEFKDKEGKQYTLSAYQQKGRNRICIPVIFEPDRGPRTIEFSTKWPFQTLGFGKFLGDELKTVVTNWNSLTQGRKWCKERIPSWTNYIHEKWLCNHQKKRKCVNGDESHPVFMVQVPGFSEDPKKPCCIRIQYQSKKQRSTGNRLGVMIIYSKMTFISLVHMQTQKGFHFHKIWGKNNIYLTCSHAGTGRHSFPLNLGRK